MLTGKIIYNTKCSELTPNDKELYYFKGVDSSTTLYGQLYAPMTTGIDFMEGEVDSDGYPYKRIDINLTNVKIQTVDIPNPELKLQPPSPSNTNNGVISLSEFKNRKKIKETILKPVNTDFFVTIASVIRYVKTHCYKKYDIDYTGLDIAETSFVAKTEVTYRIPMDKKDSSNPDKYLGTVTLDLGVIKSLHIKTETLQIDLDWDDGEVTQQFYDIKKALQKGFRLTSEHLKFYVAPPKIVKTNTYGVYTSLDEVIQNNPEKNFKWLLSNKYVIVDDDNLDEIYNKLMNHKGKIFFDTETTGLKINFLSRIGQGDQLVGVVLSIKAGESYYFPLRHKRIKNLCNGDDNYFMGRYMKPLLEKKELVAHNMVFDWKVAYIYGINANIVDDTMLMIRLTYGAERKGFPSGLKDLASLLLHRDSLELSDLVVDDKWGENDITFADLPYELVRLYAPADTDNTLGIYNYVINTDLLQKYNAHKIYQIEVIFALAVAYQEFYGHKVDTDSLPAITQATEEGLARCREKLAEIAGYDFNPDSAPQLSRIMYDELNIPEQIDRKTGRRTTSKEAIKYLSKIEDMNGDPMYPFVQYLKEYRDHANIKKNFLKNLGKLSSADGYIFSTVQQTGTTTGRVSVKEPNYQSYNDAVKKNIVPRPEYYNTDNDYSSIEYRVLGSISGQQNIIIAFRDPELDYHAYQASRMNNVPYEAVTSDLRRSAKSVNFGLPYGMGDESLGVAIFGFASEENTAKAAQLRKKYFEGQENVLHFFEKARAEGVQKGYTETYYGRRRYYDPSKFSKNAIMRQAGNQVIQGSAADFYKVGVGRLFLRICKEGWLGKALIPAFVHDEIYCEVHNSINPIHWLKAVKESFELEIEGFCPFYIGFGFGMSWYEAKKTEIPVGLQNKMVEKWGITGYPEWDGDGRKFADKVVVMIRDYNIENVEEYLLASENQGKAIKPAINTSLHDILKEDIGIIKDIIVAQAPNLVTEVEEKKGKVKYLDNVNIKKATINELIEVLENHGLYNEVVLRAKLKERNILGFSRDIVLGDITDLQLAIDQFSILHDLDRSKIDIVKATDLVISNKDDIEERESIAYFVETEEDRLIELKKLKESRIDTYGVYMDTKKKEVVFKLSVSSLMDIIIKYLNDKGEGYKVLLRDDNGVYYSTKYYCEPRLIPKIQELYMKVLQQSQAQ